MVQFKTFRTISPSLEAKTSETYYDILQTLCDLVRKAGHELRDKLGQLSITSEWESIAEQISRLDSAKWLNDFRPGVHSDVKREIENKLVTFVASLERDLEERNLGLTSHASLVETYKNIVKPVSDMYVHLGPKFDKLQKPKDSIREKFTKGVINTLTFIEKITLDKEEKEGVYVSSSDVELAWCYLQAAKPLTLVEQKITEVEAKFVIKICDYCRTINTHFWEDQKSLIALDEKTSTDDIAFRCQRLVNCVQVMLQLSIYAPTIYKSARFIPQSDRAQAWLRNMRGPTYLHFDTKAESKDTELLEKLRFAVQRLVDLDDIDISGKAEKKYIDLYEKIHQNYRNLQKVTEAEFESAIEKQDYEWLFTEYKILEERTDGASKVLLAKIKRPLANSINTLLDQAEDKVGQLRGSGTKITAQDIRPIVQLLRKLKGAKKFKLVSDFEEKEKKFLDDIQKFKKKLEEAGEGCIKNNNYLGTLQQNYIIEMLTEQFTVDRKDEPKLLEKVREILNQIINEYKSLDFKKDASISSTLNQHRPVVIVAKLMEVGADVDYAGTFEWKGYINKIESTLRTQVADELQAIRTAGRDRNNTVDLIRSRLQDFPEELRKHIETDLTLTERRLGSQDEKYAKQVKESLKEEKLKTLSSLLSEGTIGESFQAQIRDGIEKRVNEYSSSIQSILTAYKDPGPEPIDKDLLKVLENPEPIENALSKLVEYAQEFPEYKKLCGSNLEKVRHAAQQAARYLKPPDTSVSDTDIKDFKRRLDIIPFFCKIAVKKELKSIVKDDKEYKTREDSTFQDIESLHIKWTSWLEDLYQKYQELFAPPSTTTATTTTATTATTTATTAAATTAATTTATTATATTATATATETELTAASFLSFPVFAGNKWREILHLVTKWEPFIQKLGIYAQDYKSTLPLFEQSLNALSKSSRRLSTKEITKSLINVVKATKQRVMEAKLYQEDWNSDPGLRNAYFKHLESVYKSLDSVNEVKSLVEGSVDISVTECRDSLIKKLEDLFDVAKEFMERGKSDPSAYERVSKIFSIFNEIATCISVLRSIAEKYARHIETALLQVVVETKSDISKGSTKDIATGLIKMKEIALSVGSLKIKIDERIERSLDEIQAKHGPAIFGQLGTHLDKQGGTIGKYLIAEHESFKGYNIFLFNTKINRLSIEEIMEIPKEEDKKYVKEVPQKDIDRKFLIERYGEFKKCYEELVKQNLTFLEQVENGQNTSKKKEFNTKQFFLQIHSLPVKKPLKCAYLVDGQGPRRPVEWDKATRDEIPSLVAYICAAWTLRNSKYYFAASKKDGYLVQPHAAQIIAIFRLLNIEGSKEGLAEKVTDWLKSWFQYGSKPTLANHLVEILTGEGKSAILAITAAILGLFGFDVSVACYSGYLSSRDFSDWKWLFEGLGLLEQIHYGTFSELCERVINEHGHIRERVLQLIKDGKVTVKSQKSQRTKILLLDEVDVFFKRDFYGNLYNPIAMLKDSHSQSLSTTTIAPAPTGTTSEGSITKLINFIWSQKNSITLSVVQQSTQFKECSAKFPGWENLLLEATKEMISELRELKTHEYHVEKDKIWYKDQDTLSDKIYYGYKTLFAYYQEKERGNITQTSLNNQISILIRCGSFSYAEIPQTYSCIMGVTGTLQALSEPETQVIRDEYFICKHTYIPSVYTAEGNRSFDRKDGIIIRSNQTEYFNAISDQIKARLSRAVLVFFESETRLREFYNSPPASALKKQISILTERVVEPDKSDLIRRATSVGRVTLLTRSLGRGTDFVVHDEEVVQKGGVHVIQTFLSEEVSEEIQIQGRTARQGQQGSYSLVLLLQDLEKFLITKEEVEKGGIYQLLDSKRNNYFKVQYSDSRNYVVTAAKKHVEGLKFLKDLDSDNVVECRKFLEKENKGPLLSAPSRTICLMDATGSMSHLLQKTKNSVETMFSRAIEILEEKKVAERFEMKFVVYRNYNSLERILDSTGWESKPENLRFFMDKVQPEGGLGNEAIEMGFWNVNQLIEEAKKEGACVPSQVILIGDAAPNTEDQIKKYRLHFKYWEKDTKFGKPTHYKEELKKIKDIPVHCFYVAEAAKESFKEIATETKGECGSLDINSPAGSEMLTNVVTMRILADLEKIKNITDGSLVKTYQSKFNTALHA